jgi:hypothetical protein
MRKHHKLILGPVLALWIAVPGWAQSACDLDSNGATNSDDVTRAVNMTLGAAPCTANVEGPQTCSVVTVQRVVNAALGQACVTYSGNTRVVALSWIASSTAGVAGYNLYRRTSPAGVPTKVNAALIGSISYVDETVQAGQTYYYSATAVDGAGVESVHSSQVSAAIPAN